DDVWQTRKAVLHDIIPRSGADHPCGFLLADAATDDDDGHFPVQLENALQRLLSTHARQVVIRDDAVPLTVNQAAAKLAQSVNAHSTEFSFVPLQLKLKQLKVIRVVLYHQ